MIVLDEQLSKPRITQDIARWYRGAIVNISDLRPATQILDDAIPTLLRTVANPTFVTINYNDFWRIIPARSYYCVVCLKLAQDNSAGVSPLLREVLRLPEFRTKRARMGCVISVRESAIDFYRA